MSSYHEGWCLTGRSRNLFTEWTSSIKDHKGNTTNPDPACGFIQAEPSRQGRGLEVAEKLGSCSEEWRCVARHQVLGKVSSPLSKQLKQLCNYKGFWQERQPRGKTPALTKGSEAGATENLDTAP